MTRPLWYVTRRMQRQLDGWKLVAWLLLIGWWWYPTVFVVWFFYAIIKYSIPVLVSLYNVTREVKNGHGFGSH